MTRRSKYSEAPELSSLPDHIHSQPGPLQAASAGTLAFSCKRNYRLSAGGRLVFKNLSQHSYAPLLRLSQELIYKILGFCNFRAPANEIDLRRAESTATQAGARKNLIELFENLGFSGPLEFYLYTSIRLCVEFRYRDLPTSSLQGLYAI
jgi:hypothetical protein